MSLTVKRLLTGYVFLGTGIVVVNVADFNLDQKVFVGFASIGLAVVWCILFVRR